MKSDSRSGKSSGIRQILIVQAVIILILLGILCVALDFFNISELILNDTGNERHRISYQVTTSGGNGKAYVKYLQEDGEMSETILISTPWEKDLILKTGTNAILTAYIPGESEGEIRCEIIQAGKLIDSDSETFENKAACGARIY